MLEMCVAAGSFAAAADRLYLSPAAVSLRIRTLETELGQALFMRVGRRVVPTPAATALASRVRGALNDIADALDTFQAATPALRVTAPPTFVSRWLAPRLSGYAALGRPSIELDVSSDVREPNTFDVAIRTGRGGWAGLEEHPLMPVDVTPMVAPELLGTSTLSTPEDLAHFELLPHPDWEHWFSEAKSRPPRDLRFVGVDYQIFELSAHAALEGRGVALLSPALFRPFLAEGRLVAPFSTVLSGPEWYFALMREGDSRPAPQDFCSWLGDQARNAA